MKPTLLEEIVDHCPTGLGERRHRAHGGGGRAWGAGPAGGTGGIGTECRELQPKEKIGLKGAEEGHGDADDEEKKHHRHSDPLAARGLFSQTSASMVYRTE